MELVLRHFWIAFVVVTFVNGRTWRNRVQGLIQEQPALGRGYQRLYRGYVFWLNVPWIGMGAGVLSGQVTSIFDFLRPGDGNVFVLWWWGLNAVLLCLGTYWIFFRGGAQTLAQHPGVYMVPRWGAAKLRLFWLGVVAWNVGIATLLFVGFPSPTEPSQGPTSWLWALFPVFFVGMWLLISFILSTTGGWSTLANHYAARSGVAGRRFYFRSAQLGAGVSYGACLTLGTSPAGLYMAVVPLFRMAHPPLLIPWPDITARETKSWFSATVELRFAKVPMVSVRISRQLADALFAASGEHILVQPAA